MFLGMILILLHRHLGLKTPLQCFKVFPVAMLHWRISGKSSCLLAFDDHYRLNFESSDTVTIDA